MSIYPILYLALVFPPIEWLTYYVRIFIFILVISKDLMRKLQFMALNSGLQYIIEVDVVQYR